MSDLQVVETQEIETKANQLAEAAGNLFIENSQALTRAGTIKDALQSILGDINDTFEPIINKAHVAHKEALKAMKKHADPVKALIEVIDSKMTTYVRAEERKRRDEERRLEEEARKRSQEEQLKAAMAAEAAGQEEKVEAILDEPTPAPVVVLPRDDLKVKGHTMRSNWTFRVASESAVPREYLMLDMVKIRKIVKAMKGATAIAGIEAYDDAKMTRTGR